MNKDEIAGLRGLSDDALQKVSNAFDYGETLNVASMRQIVEILADELEMIISQPDCDGDFEGDVWFGHPEKRTLGTHIWRAGLWHELPTELDAVISLLGQARSQRDANADALTTLSAENERLERRNASDRECWRLAAENCAALSARVETLEAQVQAASKAEMDRLRYITGDQLAFAEERLLRHDADFKIPPRKDAVRYCTALADALESHHD